MLDIPTAKAKIQARRSATAPDTTGGLGTQPASSTPMAGPGMTNLYQSPTTTPVEPIPAPAWEGSGMGANEYVTSKIGDWGGQKNYDEISRLLTEYNTQQQKATNWAPEPSISWRGDTPGLQYNPGGGTDWTTLTPDMYSDPTIAGMLQTGAGNRSPAQALFQSELGKVPSPVYNPTVSGGGPVAGGGSQHSIAPEVMNKMWR